LHAPGGGGSSGPDSQAAEDETFWSPTSTPADYFAPTEASPFAGDLGPPVATDLSAQFEEQAVSDKTDAAAAAAAAAGAAAAARAQTLSQRPSPRRELFDASPGSPQVTSGLLRSAARAAAAPQRPTASPGARYSTLELLPVPPAATTPQSRPPLGPQLPAAAVLPAGPAGPATSEETLTATPPRSPAAAAAAADAELLPEVNSEAGRVPAPRWAPSRRPAHSCPNPKIRCAPARYFSRAVAACTAA